MALFEVIVGLLMAAAILSVIADRVAVPYPVLLSIAGTGAAFIPGVPAVTLDPALVLALFVAPVLLDAAYDASPRDLRDNLLPVATLALVAVSVTVAAVAVVARLILPDLPWAAAIALGAIVAPPDASAATAILRRLRPPHRILVILEGESLFNDASALLIYRLAVTAAMTGSFSALAAGPTLLLTAGGGAALGYAAARAWMAVSPRLFDSIPISVLVQFLATFAVWLAAEALHLSAIITIVVYGMTVARYAPMLSSARRRIASYAVWEVAVFVVNALAFLLIGLQMREVVLRLDGDWPVVVLLAVATCATVVVARLAWVMTYNAVARWNVRRTGPAMARGKPLLAPTVGGGLVISWSGMRGVVTLAAALALPAGFPGRDAIVFASVCVVLFTLWVQGLTLGPLLRHLGLRDTGAVEAELVLARRETAEAAIRALSALPEGPGRDGLLGEYRARAALTEPEPSGSPGGPAALQRQAVAACRQSLDALRRAGTIGDDAHHAIEEEIDLLELTADPRVRAG